MRKEYILNPSTFTSDFFNSLDDFMGNFTSLYTLIFSITEGRVYHNNDENLDLMFYAVDIDTIILIVTPNFNSSKEIWMQEKIVNLGYDYARSNINKDGKFYVENAAYYIPAPTLKTGAVLVANYNKENDTFMFSVHREITVNYIFASSPTIIRRTMNLFFGSSTKYLSFDGGFFYGGDFVFTYERFYRESVIKEERNKIEDGVFCIYDADFKDIKFHIQPQPLGYTAYWNNPWVSNPYGNKDCCCRNKKHMPEPHHTNRFDAILRADIDNAMNRRKDEVIKVNPDVSFMPEYKRTDIWAITMDTDYYVPMVCSITSSETPLPRYEPLLSHDFIERGYANNTLNNISTIMPLWFMIRRDPIYLNTFSAACKNDVINFVNMYNMYSDRQINGTFPIKESYEYDCFHSGCRRSMFGMMGYSGIAFKQEKESDPSSSPANMSLLDLV